MRFLYCCLFTFFWSLCFADYIETDLLGLVSKGKLCVYGEIVKVETDYFVVHPEKIIQADTIKKSYKVGKFKDWVCAERSEPYRSGQRIILFASPNHNKYETFQYNIVGAGNEGELLESSGNVAYNGNFYPALEFIRAVSGCYRDHVKLKEMILNDSLDPEIQLFSGSHPIQLHFVNCIKNYLKKSLDTDFRDSVQSGRAVVSNDAYNIVYRGIENHISIAVPGVKSENLTVTVNQGTIVGSRGKYIAVPAQTGEFSIYVTYPCSDSTCTDIHFFRHLKCPSHNLRSPVKTAEIFQ